MKGGIWVNPEIKRAAVVITVVNIILFAGLILTLNFYFSSLNRKLLYQNIGTIGTLVSKHPELKTDIVSAFTKTADSGDLAKGISQAQKYGYSPDLPLISNGILNTYSIMSSRGLWFFAALCLIVNLVFILFNYRGIYKRLDHFSLAVEKIVEGDFSTKLYEEKEGAFSRLGHQFNQMSNRLQHTLEELKEEKLYLKDTISDISHQLKTPLTAMKILNDLLIEGAVEIKEKRDEFLQRNKVQLERMEWLILNLLKLARIETGTVEFRDEKASLFNTIEEAVNELSVTRREKKQRLDMVVDSEDVFIYHDSQWLKEAFSNIIKNSIEHTGEGGAISVKLIETPVMVRVIIKDNGEGIPKEDLPYIFQRFYRGKNSIYGKGTGIGLALAKTIIEKENGIITVKSELKEGTEFIITFVKNTL